ncbi:MAG TPA: thioredoxin domain-containing protein [Nitrospirota bacterium]|nr:thioredoxin domain-containing protein [Nitrospirota bacterium]
MENLERWHGDDRRSGGERRKLKELNFPGTDGRSGKERRHRENRLFLIRCYNCLMLNRVPQNKLFTNPVCGNCKTTLEFPQQPVWAKIDSFDRLVAHWPETLLVVFTSPLCVYCKIVDPVLQDLSWKKAGQLKVMKVDTESDFNLAERFKIEKTPTFIVYKNGEKILRVDGAPKDKTDIVKWVGNIIDFTSY